MHALIIDNSVEEYPATLATLKKRHPGVSFPRSFDDFACAEYGVVSVLDNGTPSFNSFTHKLESTAIEQINGVWTKTYTVVELTNEETTEQTNAVASKQRAKRNDLLAASDWTQLSDSSADTAAWATYRQQLRDLPTSSGSNWPHTVTWPTEPS